MLVVALVEKQQIAALCHLARFAQSHAVATYQIHRADVSTAAAIAYLPLVAQRLLRGG